MKIHALAAQQMKGSLEPFNYEQGPLGPKEIDVAITHCGICHSDVHLVDNDWNTSIYPLVPGHEIIGTVKNLGNQVKHLKIGQRVGIGWQCASCLDCEFCHSGEENLCSYSQAVAVGHFGGFAESVRSDAYFALPIPEKLSSEQAAPLLCGGITVYSPLRDHVKPYMKVGVIGIGGLGHLALQFARAFGCEVTAFSSNPSKESEAKKFGAHHFVASNNDQILMNQAKNYDFILSTVNVDLNWEIYINLLRPHGKLCFVGVGNRINIPMPLLIMGEKSICGSVIGGPLRIVEMLEFAARHDIKALTQALPMSQAQEGLDRVRKNKARYRVVLEN